MKQIHRTCAAIAASLMLLMTACASKPPTVVPEPQTLTVQTLPKATAPPLSPTETPEPTATPSATPKPTTSPTAKPTATPTPKPKATVKPATLTPEKEEEILKEPVQEESKNEDNTIQQSRPTPPPVVDSVPTPSPTKEPAKTPTPTKTPKPTASPSATPKPGASPSPTPKPTPTPSPTPDPSYTGWVSGPNGDSYLVAGKPITGWQSIGGRRYFFDESGILQSRTGIDVSSYQGSINWQKVAADDISFAFLRIGGQYYRQEGGFYKDSYFESNYSGATKAGLDVGVYFFSQAITPQEAQEEALWVVAQLKGRGLDLPIVYDLEDPAADSRFHLANLNRQEVTDLCTAFCETIEANGYDAMVYTNPDWIRNRLDINQLSQYPLWIAHYTTAKEPSAPSWWRSWQYTSVGKVSGINGSVDMNVMR